MENQEHKVYLIEKILYGLKQSPRVWYQTLSEFVQTMTSNVQNLIMVFLS